MRTADERELRIASIRLAAQFTLVIVALFVALGAVVYTVVSAGQAEAARRTLADASAVDSVHDAPRSLLVTVVTPAGRESSPGLPDGLPDEQALTRVADHGGSLTETITAGGRRYLTATRATRGRLVQISYGLAEQEEELQRLLLALVASGGIAAVAAGAVGLVLARKTMRPMAEALALQRRFVADAGHELRTPLTLLSTRAQLLRRSATRTVSVIPDDVRIGLDEIVDDSRALTEIVEDLLIAADPRQTPQRTSVDLGELAVAVARSTEGRARERGVTVETHCAAGATVHGAPVSLRRMIVALVDNALDHARSTVRVDVVRNRGVVTLTVSDDGPGFSEESQHHAFERFASTRGATSGTSPGRHYGLGLALVAEVVARHGGSVRASNDPRTGGAVVFLQIAGAAGPPAAGKGVSTSGRGA